jgi:hypothetical protein
MSSAHCSIVKLMLLVCTQFRRLSVHPQRGLCSYGSIVSVDPVAAAMTAVARQAWCLTCCVNQALCHCC